MKGYKFTFNIVYNTLNNTVSYYKLYNVQFIQMANCSVVKETVICQEYVGFFFHGLMKI